MLQLTGPAAGLLDYLIGPVGALVALALIIYAFVIKDPPYFYTRRQVAALEARCERAEADRDWYYREALEANGVTGKALDLVRRRETGDQPSPAPAPPPGPWAPRPETAT